MKNIPLYEVRPIHDLRDMIQQSVNLYGDKPVFLVKDPRAIGQVPASSTESTGKPETRSAPYLPVTYRKFARDVDALGTWFFAQSLQGSRIAILAETRYEWYVTYLATVNGTGIVVPLDKELPQAEIANLLNRSQADVLVYASSKQKEVDAIRSDLTTVKKYIAMDLPPVTGDLSFWDCLTEGEALLAQGSTDFTTASIDPEALSILLFTSGTTAMSKAVMLNHRNLCINLQAMCQMLYIAPDDIFLSVLPLHHTYECTCGFLCPVYRGATVAVCEGLRHITRNMQESKVTIMLAVPLMLELFYKRILKSATSDPKLAKKFRLGLKISGLLRKIGIDKRKKLFAKVHDNFGGHLRLLIAGGAAIDPAIIAGLRDLGLESVQGYGLTECAPILALNRDIDYKDNAAGLPLPGVEIKIVDPDENGIGEIVGRGPNVMMGYYENEEATNEAIDSEGFFHTGDLGYLDKDDFVIITGRKKNVIIAKNGKNIFPEEIEFKLLQNDLIAECLVSGRQDEEGDTIVRADIFPNEEKVREVFGDVPLDSKDVREAIDQIIRSVNHGMVTYKYIREFDLRPTEFEKTSSKKIKRTYSK
ncbi:MAG: long-chain fatty acid--CoA ligase [Clostridia bacterium]|nr:long-chain fatty acid--CoA ligase [Clostridia bacterium]